MMYLGIFLLVFLILAFVKVPVPFAMGIGAIVTMVMAGGAIEAIPQSMFRALNVFTFLAIPAFIFAGDLMTAAGISAAIMRFAKSFIARVRGAEGAVTVITCALFGAITGSSMATITGIGGMMLPELEKAGYDKKYATALVSTCGFLGILIPPSIPGILYAMMAGENVMKVWLCTVGPGILLCGLYIVINYFRVGIHEEKTKEPFRPGEYVLNIARKTGASLDALLMPFIIFYGKAEHKAITDLVHGQYSVFDRPFSHAYIAADRAGVIRICAVIQQNDCEIAACAFLFPNVNSAAYLII